MLLPYVDWMDARNKLARRLAQFVQCALAFILFRWECYLKKNEAEAVAANEGDPIARRQRQADLFKTISQRWRSLSAEDRKYWDDLAKQRKKEHEEMYPWYVYQLTRATKGKKGKTESAAGGNLGGRRMERVIAVIAQSRAAVFAALPAQLAARSA